MKVFISSTQSDLLKHRRAVISLLQKAGGTPITMEHKAPAIDAKPLDECLRMVKDADVYVGIFAWRYGSKPPRRRRSFTHCEYDEAKRLGKPRFLFIVDPSYPWPEKQRDSGSDAERLGQLRKSFEKERWSATFTSPDNLAGQVLASLNAYSPGTSEEAIRRSQERREEGQTEEEEALRRTVESPRPPMLTFPVSENFKDRVEQLHYLRRCLDDPRIRAILVCGRGGTGKTQLIRKLISDLSTRLVSDSNWQPLSVAFVSLIEADSRSPEVIVDLIGRAMDPQSGDELRRSWKDRGPTLGERIRRFLTETLRVHRCIVVLDNLESVLDDDNRIKEEYAGLRLFVEEFLRCEHSSVLLATSRRELAFSSPDIEASAIGRKALLCLDEGLPIRDAVALIRELGAGGERDLGIQDATDSVLEHVAERCERVPYSLVSLVVRLRRSRSLTLQVVLSDEEMLADIVDKPQRAIYSSLQSDDERLVVQAMAVCQQFEDSVPPLALSHMLPGIRVHEILDRLAANHIISYPGTAHRFALHPLLLQHAYEQVAWGPGDAFRRQMHKLIADFYDRCTKPEPEWKRFQDLQPKLRQFRHLVRADLNEEGCRLLIAIRERLTLWGYESLVAELAEQLMGKLSDPVLDAINAGNCATAYLQSEGPDKALPMYENIIPRLHELGIKDQEGRFIGNRGLAKDSKGDARGGEQDLVEALEIARKVDDRIHQCRWLGNLATLRYSHGWATADEAVRDLEESVRIADELDPPDYRFEELWCLTLGRILAQAERADEAVGWMARAAQVALDTGDLSGECVAYLELRALHNKLGQTEKADEYLDRVKARIREVSKPEHSRDLVLCIGNVYGEMGQKQEQLGYYREALERARALGDATSSYRIMTALVELYHKAGMYEDALAECKRLCQSAEEGSDAAQMTMAAMCYGDALARLSKAADSIEAYERALELARKHEQRSMEIDSAYRLATLHRALNDPRRALDYYTVVLPLVEQRGNLYGQIRVLNEMGIAYYDLRDFAEATSCYSKSLDAARAAGDIGGIAVASFNIGDAFHMDGKPSQAIPCYEQVMATERAKHLHYICALTLGIAHMQLGDPQKAKPYFERCIALCEEKGAVANELKPFGAAKGISLLALGKTHEALEAYRSGLDDLATPELVNYALEDIERLKLAPALPGLHDAELLLRDKLAGLETSRDETAVQ